MTEPAASTSIRTSRLPSRTRIGRRPVVGGTSNTLNGLRTTRWISGQATTVIPRITVRNRRDGHSYFIQVGIAEDQIQRVRPTAAPAPDGDPIEIDITTSLCQRAQRRRKRALIAAPPPPEPEERCLPCHAGRVKPQSPVCGGAASAVHIDDQIEEPFEKEERADEHGTVN